MISVAVKCGCCLTMRIYLSPLIFVVSIGGLHFNCSKLWLRVLESVFRFSNCLVTQRPKLFQFRTRWFLNWVSIVLDWDSCFFTRWVPGLTITISNKITDHSCKLFFWSYRLTWTKHPSYALRSLFRCLP